MKKIFKLLFATPLIVLPIFGITSCKNKPYDNNVEIVGKTYIEINWNQNNGRYIEKYEAHINGEKVNATWIRPTDSKTMAEFDQDMFDIDTRTGEISIITIPVFGTTSRDKTFYKIKIQAKVGSKINDFIIAIKFDELAPDTFSFVNSTPLTQNITVNSLIGSYPSSDEMPIEPLLSRLSQTSADPQTDISGTYTEQNVLWNFSTSADYFYINPEINTYWKNGSNFTTIFYTNALRLRWNLPSSYLGAPLTIKITGSNPQTGVSKELTFNVTFNLPT